MVQTEELQLSHEGVCYRSPTSCSDRTGFCDSPPRRIPLQQNLMPAGASLLPPSRPNQPTFSPPPNEHDPIKGEFVVGPCIRILPSMLPPLGEGDTEDDRKNLCLSSGNGSVGAEIWPLGSGVTGPAGKPRRTTVALTSGHGSIRAQLVRPLDLVDRTILTGAR